MTDFNKSMSNSPKGTKAKAKVRFRIDGDSVQIVDVEGKPSKKDLALWKSLEKSTKAALPK